MSELFSPAQLGPYKLASRIVMAPMTRCRASQPGDIPNDLMATYYAQRASAGLIITEATQISPQGKGYSFTPGIYSSAQIAGWRKVTEAVHNRGGKIYNQLWHVGRMSHASFHGGQAPVAPSAVEFDGQVWVYNEQKQTGEKLACPVPRALDVDGIHQIIADYRQAALNALAAGFDGVEIHGANGYLIDQFLRTTSNQRTDEYGGSQENRLRFLKEVVSAVADVVGADRVGIRLAPYITAKGMNCPEIIPTILAAATFLHEKNISYLHLAEADWDDAPHVDDSFRRELRARFGGKIMVAGKLDKTRAESLVRQGYADLVAFGRPFVANPDLPARLAHNLPLQPIGTGPLFGGDSYGYTDYAPHTTA